MMSWEENLEDNYAYDIWNSHFKYTALQEMTL